MSSPAPPSLDTLTERLDGVRHAATVHEQHDADRHEQVMDAITQIRDAGDRRGDRVVEMMVAQQQLVIRAAGLIVGLLIVGLFGVLGVGLGVEVPGLGSVGIAPAAAAPVPERNTPEQPGTPEQTEQPPKE